MGYLNNDGLNKVFTKLKSQLDLKQDVLQVCYTNTSMATPTEDTVITLTKFATITNSASGILYINDISSYSDTAMSFNSGIFYRVEYTPSDSQKFKAKLETFFSSGEYTSGIVGEIGAPVIGFPSSNGNSYDLYICPVVADECYHCQIINFSYSENDSIELLSNQPYWYLNESDTSTITDVSVPLDKSYTRYAYYSNRANLAQNATHASDAGALRNAGTALIDQGSSIKPVFFESGKPVACDYFLEQSVPADAVFAKGNASSNADGLMSSGDWVKLHNTIEDNSYGRCLSVNTRMVYSKHATGSVAAGNNIVASGDNSISIGSETIASGINSQAFGLGSKADGVMSTAFGGGKAKQEYGFACGLGTISNAQAQMARGKYNIEDTENKYVDIVGKGLASNNRSNAYTLDYQGNGCFAGSVYVGGATISTGSKLATEEYVDSKGVPSHTHTKDDITSVNASAITGVIDSSNLPSYVDDVLEYANKSSFPATGESGKIYVDKANNLTYRWGGTDYVEISPSIALGETSSTAYRGDRGKAAYEHAASDEGVQLASGLYKITTGTEGHITAGTAVSKDDITALGIPAQDTTYSNATEDAAGLMSAADKKALDGKMNSAYPNGTGSFSMNRKANTTTGQFSFAEGYNCAASGEFSHAEGRESQSTSTCSHAEGYGTQATENTAHAENYYSVASGKHSHAEGNNSTASGLSSHAEGQGTTANSRAQHVQGEYNIKDTAGGEERGTYVHIVGNGTSSKHSNAHTLDWDGNAWYAGDVYVGGANQAAGSKLATESFVNTATDGFVPDTRTVNGKALSSDITLAKADFGLGNVDNTADANKNVLSASKWTTARTLTIGNKGNTVDGSGNVSWSLSDIGAAASNHNHNASYFALASTNNATGSQWLNNSTIDGGDFTSSSTLYGYSFGFKDKNSNTIGQIRTIQATNLLTEVEARRTVGSNTYYNYLRVGLSKTGEQLYQLSSPSAFRSAIGITSGTAAPASSGTAGSIYIQYS